MRTRPALALALALVAASGCATGQRQHGNLARALLHPLMDYGARFPRIDLESPGIGVDQMYTSWRQENDPGGFRMVFREGALGGVLHQVQQIAGPPQATTDGPSWVWLVDGVAHIDLVQLPDGRGQLTCRRLAPNPTALATTPTLPTP